MLFFSLSNLFYTFLFYSNFSHLPQLRLS